MSVLDDYRRIDGLLEARARDYPRRVEPTWSDLLAAIDDLAARLREEVEPVPEPLPGYYGRPIFVVGHRKTGTTLVQELLDGHPQLAVLPGESNHFNTFLPRDPERVAADAQSWWLLRLISPSGIPPFWSLGREPDAYAAFTARLLGLAAANPERDVLGMAAVALASGEPRAWVEKTPGHEHRLEQILALYPQARFVHVVRDPRSVAAAILRLDRATGRETDVLGVGLTIRRSFEAAERNRGERYLALRYEDLVADPASAMRRVAELAGIDWSDSLLTPTVGGVEATSNSAWSARKVTGEIESRRLDLWREELDDDAAGLVVAAAGPAARRFGYELAAPGIVAAARAGLRRARVGLARRRR
ncbi:MAG TPA: sulfotransferase [Gaiellaceae bacterium]|nr:sulfotransferase [Gaiellaceae bacterium]